jgi:hypothetical protein
MAQNALEKYLGKKVPDKNLHNYPYFRGTKIILSYSILYY